MTVEYQGALKLTFSDGRYGADDVSAEDARKQRSCYSMMTCGAAFQVLGYFMFVGVVLAKDPLWTGVAFLEKIPPNF